VIIRYYAVSVEHRLVTDRQTDRQTDRHNYGIYRASMASNSKNWPFAWGIWTFI